MQFCLILYHRGSDVAYEKVGGDIQTIFRSEIRARILITLSEKSKTLSELVDVIGSTAQVILKSVKDLEQIELLERRKRGEYQLTPIGRAVCKKVEDFIRLLYALRRHSDFWLTHDLEALPKPFLCTLGALVNSKVVESTVDSSASINTATKVLEGANERILGVVSINDVKWKKAVVEAVRRGVRLSVVTTKDVFDISGRGNFKKYTKQFLLSPNVDWRINEDIRLALGVTEKAMGLMLYTKDGLLDTRRILTSENQEALEWGEEVYKYYRERSAPLNRMEAFAKVNLRG